MKKIALLAACAAFFIVGSAKADQFDYGSFGEINGQNITITSPTRSASAPV